MKKLKNILFSLLQTQYPDKSIELLDEIDIEFTQMAEDKQWPVSTKNPLDKRLPVAAYLLAIIKVLDAQNESYENIRELILNLTTQLTKPQNQVQQFIKNLAPMVIASMPVRFFLKLISRRLEESAHPAGFSVKVLTAKEETLGFGYGLDVLECGICKLFARQKYVKFTHILCEVDYITSSMAGLQLVRRGTIANGAKKCDFRYLKSNK